jgi:hypothetical protein
MNKELLNFEYALGLWQRFNGIISNMSRIRDMIKPGVTISDDDYNHIVSLIDEVENNV